MKKKLTTFVAFAFAICAMADVPLVYNVENTASGLPDPVFPTIDELPYIEPLTDPFEFSDGSRRAVDFSDWSKRRGEIAREIMHYEIGEKPAVSLDDIEATLEDGQLTVNVTVNGKTLTLTSKISYPEGDGPFPLMIGADNNSLPSSMLSERNIATMNFTASQVNGYSQFGGSATHPILDLYPELDINGAYSHWAWGFSRLIDGLQKLGTEVTKIDMDHIGVTGCSYAGKMALFCGAFDERVALTIPQESGGGGCAAWRVTRVHNRDYPKEDAWEGLDNTDYNWFMKSLQNTFGNNKTFYLPYDHHELVALCCPRALLMLGNPDYRWLGDGSGYVSMVAARKVWQQYGIGDRCGFSIIGGHSHCQLPDSQNAVVEAYLDKFLLGLDVDIESVLNYNVAPIYEEGGDRYTPLEELSQWMDWWGKGEAPLLPNFKEEAVTLFIDPVDAMQGGCVDWSIEADETSVTGSHFLAVNKNTDVPSDPNQALVFEFNIEKAGKYYPYAYVNCNGSTKDAVWIAYDDAVPGKSNGATTKGAWAWKSLYNLLDTEGKQAFNVNLSVGKHKLSVYTKEAGYKLGFICISNLDMLNDFNDAVADMDLNDIFKGSGVMTAVSEIEDMPAYDLFGRKIGSSYKGIAVKNGKKIIIK